MTIYKKLILFVISVLILSCPLPQSGESTSLFSTMFADTHNYWTIMYYVDGDNNLEQALLDDMEELSKGLAGTEMITVIALIDRIAGGSSDSTLLGVDFTDTRLFRIGSDTFYSLSGEEFLPGIEQGTGEEYNMGDAQTLKKFIEYCKKYFPADNYGLIFSNHGSGVRSYSGTDPSDFTKGGTGLSDGSLTLLDKSIAYDDTSLGDSIYTAELTDVLDDSHSVDLLVYDACLMGLLEIAYQYRPGVAGEFSADYMVASAPNVWYYGYPYDRIFSRIFHFTQDTGLDSTVTGTSQSMFRYAPADLTPERLGRIFVEEQKLDTGGGNAQVLALYDLSKAEPVTIAFNAVAADLGDIVLNVDGESNLDSIRSNILSYISVTDPDPIGAPHYDLYEFAQDTTGSVGVGKRDSLKNAVDDMVGASFGNMVNFDEGTDGLGFFFPDGNVPYGTENYWYQQDFYTGEDLNAIIEGRFYGKLDFCSTDDDGIVDSWFELLQKFYNPYNPQGSAAEQDDYDQFHPGRW